MLAHKGIEEGIFVAEIIAGLHNPINYDNLPSVIYTEPEIAWVGQTEQALRATGEAIKIGIFPLTSAVRSLAMGKTERAGKYGGGGWDCVGLAVWTTTGVTDMPNFVNMAKCTGITTGNDMKSSALSVFDKFGDTRGLLILVRNK